ncbi:Snx41p NDAI_0C01040 [Naumovozyma dairenensis CBS 421]|uniref:PX domain-containing protein n=1 Tax=Naumovozyma dairenensis (strain ATCC 10597 / BCRC 20456 / CBS 421 / NBRC 0211 / NRRL Y-12639) TaxID=1071378 RepID=G0W7K4_NAUDC|nr:hypothetical protein NDAI_0C01040 [Naumovozyma dairenensis CBS 421]CCD23765.1 hypothetical protein NDAI_0C01040 [Naumovozyma dairenensis CBS 421]
MNIFDTLKDIESSDDREEQEPVVDPINTDKDTSTLKLSQNLFIDNKDNWTQNKRDKKKKKKNENKQRQQLHLLPQSQPEVLYHPDSTSFQSLMIDEEDNNPFVGTNHLYASGINTTPPSNSPSSFSPSSISSSSSPSRSIANNEHHIKASNSINSLVSSRHISSTEEHSQGNVEEGPTSNNKNALDDELSYHINLSDNNNNPESPIHDIATNNESKNDPQNFISALSDGSSNEEPFETLSMSLSLAKIKKQNTKIYNQTSHFNDQDENDQDYSNDDDDDDEIQVIDTGDYKDPWGKHAIGYVIQYNGSKVTRRYSEFDTLYQVLKKLLPTIVVPPIPSKHPLINYFINPIHVQNDLKIIEKRKRKFISFLNNCNKIDEIRNLSVFQKFLNPEYSWKDVLNSPPIVILPLNNLLAPPLNPTKPSPLHILLPSPASITRLDYSIINDSNESLHLINNKFIKFEKLLKDYKIHLLPIYHTVKSNKSNLIQLSNTIAKLGAYYNAFSLENNVISNDNNLQIIKTLSVGIEKIGTSFDINYVLLENLIDNINSNLEESVEEMIKSLDNSFKVLHFRKLKLLQYQIIETTIKKREFRIKSLKESAIQLQKLNETLGNNSLNSPTINKTILYSEDNENNNNLQDSESPIEISTDPESSTNNSASNPRPTSKTAPIDNNRMLLKTQLERRRRKENSKKIHGFYEIDPYLLTDLERKEELKKLNKEVEKLKECFNLITKDINDVNESMENNLNHLVSYLNMKWEKSLKYISKDIIYFLQECLKSWKNAKAKIHAIVI